MERRRRFSTRPAALVAGALMAAGLAHGGGHAAAPSAGAIPAGTRTLPFGPAATSTEATAAAATLDAVFAGLDATFVLLDPRKEETLRHDPERAATRFAPMSTFKVPNMLIGLETGVLSGPDQVIAWDPARAPGWERWDEGRKQRWAHDQTLRSAFRESVVWYFQEVARRIGPERMQSHLDRFAYGNRDLSAGIDRFWLEASLRISADEQVAFLRKFREGRLGLSERTTAIAREIMALERGDGWTLCAKTGTGERAPGLWIGWLVGYVDGPQGPAYFALNLDGPSFAAVFERRMPLARRALVAAGVLPAAG